MRCRTGLRNIRKIKLGGAGYVFLNLQFGGSLIVGTEAKSNNRSGLVMEHEEKQRLWLGKL